MDQLKVCEFCRKTGKHGANHILYIGTDSHRVHLYCGEQLKQTAPEGAQVRLLPDREHAAKARAANFWSKNFRGKPSARQGDATNPSTEALPSA